MRHILKLWWNDYKETWEFAKKHPFAFTVLMTIVFLVLKLVGL